MAARSKKLLKVIDGIRSWNMSTSQVSPSKVCVGIEESLKCENFQVGKIAVHGFPHQPTCMAFDPIQKIVAIGTKMGVIRIFGRPGVDYVVSHPSSSAVIEIMFLINEVRSRFYGGIISICQDDVVHLWNIRQKNPELVHSLQFKREHLTCGHVPVASTWMYLGTDKGNVHFVNVQRFVTSGYVINWNKAIDLSQSAHPGRVVQIAESPQDPNKLLIGYSSGFLTLWDLRTKAAEARFKYSDSLNGFSWHWDGKNFLTCHNHGILATWSCKQTQRPTSVSCPHAGGDALPDDYTCYEPIHRVEWLPSKNGDPLIVFSGGSRISGYGTGPTTQTISGSSSRPDVLGPADNSVGLPDALTDPGETRDSCSPSSFMAGSRASHLSLGVKRGKRLVVMQMDYQLIQFTSLCASPFIITLFLVSFSVITCPILMVRRMRKMENSLGKKSQMMDPYAVAVLLQHDLVVVDLLSPNLAIFENPYPMDLHSSPVTACLYLVDCPGDLVPAFYSVGSRGQRQRPGPNTSASNITTESDAFSSREWPITGGEWGLSYNPYPELVLTGHADGSVRFWDASEVKLVLIFLYPIIYHFGGMVGNSVTLTPLYKVRTLRFFANSNARKTESQDTRRHGTGEPANYSVDSLNGHYCPVLLDTEDDPFAVRSIQFCPDSRLLLTASSTHVCLMHFCRREQAYEIPVMDINMAYDSLDDLVLGCVPGGDAFADDQLGSGPSGTMTKESTSTSSSGRNARCMQPSGSVSSAHSGYMVDRVNPSFRRQPPSFLAVLLIELHNGYPCEHEPISCVSFQDLRVFVPIRAGHLSWSAGYQPALICRLGIPALALDCMGTGSGSANDPTLVPPPPISAISLNSHYSLLAVGNEYGVAVLDYVNRVCLLSTAISDLCGPSDLFPRPPTNRSPGRAANSSSGLPTATDQVS
ncbi:STXB5 [Fasciola gigantica]|uniref:STXB5 n=1 Tax=Fasciola gigantica TaxID=46835 RepID=A0A504ZDC3_FASGI|nr:STXB5 [Fasciola gigantica]